MSHQTINLYKKLDWRYIHACIMHEWCTYGLIVPWLPSTVFLVAGSWLNNNQHSWFQISSYTTPFCDVTNDMVPAKHSGSTWPIGQDVTLVVGSSAFFATKKPILSYSIYYSIVQLRSSPGTPIYRRFGRLNGRLCPDTKRRRPCSDHHCQTSTCRLPRCLPRPLRLRELSFSLSRSLSSLPHLHFYLKFRIRGFKLLVKRIDFLTLPKSNLNYSFFFLV